MERVKAKAYAFRRLALRCHHSKELKEALLKKGALSSDVEEILKELTSLGYLNDEAWIESFIRKEIIKKNGKALILNKLRAKGLDAPKDSRKAFLIVNSRVQKESIRRLLETKYRSRDLKRKKREAKSVCISFFKRV